MPPPVRAAVLPTHGRPPHNRARSWRRGNSLELVAGCGGGADRRGYGSPGAGGSNGPTTGDSDGGAGEGMARRAVELQRFGWRLDYRCGGGAGVVSPPGTTYDQSDGSVSRRGNGTVRSRGGGECQWSLMSRGKSSCAQRANSSPRLSTLRMVAAESVDGEASCCTRLSRI